VLQDHLYWHNIVLIIVYYKYCRFTSAVPLILKYLGFCWFLRLLR
jgi:hypothetical protein